MKQILILLTAMLLTCCSSESEANAQTTPTTSGGKVLVAYFSFTNTTKGYADKIAQMTGGDLYEIVPEVPYGSENSNYYDQSTRAYQEQYDTGDEQRPAINATLEDASQYDIVFLGSPIWYGKSPRVILTFLDTYGFKGKTVIPFVTSMSTGIANVNSELPSTYPDVNWIEGKRVSGWSDADLQTWVEGIVGTQEDGQAATVYFTSDITAESLVRIYEALGVAPQDGQHVGVKISTGESSLSNYLRPDFIKPLVQKVGGNIVECNTAYGGTRMSTASHRQQIAERGFNDVATVDIMDEEGTVNLPVADTKHLRYDIVGSHIQNYDFIINLAHFKGHSMGGFGGVLKNQSIGFASTSGKVYVHTAGNRTSGNIWYNNNQETYQLAFLESMAAAAQAVHNYFKQEGKDIIYINVMNNLSVDCDCDGNPATPQMHDIDILASTDPVALDKACLDLVFNYRSTSGRSQGENSTSGDNASDLQNRINRQHGTHIVDYAEQIGLGTKSYQLIDLGQSSSIDGTRSAPSLRYRSAEGRLQGKNVYSLDGKKLLSNAASLDGLGKGTYIINGQKTIIQ